MFNLGQDGENVTRLIKESTFFPYKTGNLKFNATSGMPIDANTYVIHFDSTVAPYVEYLEEGTKEHNIPGAFGYDLPFGTSGRFNGKFHPGSTKHKGFIKEKCVKAIIDYFANKYNGVVEIKWLYYQK